MPTYHPYDNPHPLGHPIDGHEQVKKTKNLYSPTFSKEMYEKAPSRRYNTGFEMSYPKPLTEAQQIVADVQRTIKEELTCDKA